MKKVDYPGYILTQGNAQIALLLAEGSYDATDPMDKPYLTVAMSYFSVVFNWTSLVEVRTSLSPMNAADSYRLLHYLMERFDQAILNNYISPRTREALGWLGNADMASLRQGGELREVVMTGLGLLPLGVEQHRSSGPEIDHVVAMFLSEVDGYTKAFCQSQRLHENQTPCYQMQADDHPGSTALYSLYLEDMLRRMAAPGADNPWRVEALYDPHTDRQQSLAPPQFYLVRDLIKEPLNLGTHRRFEMLRQDRIPILSAYDPEWIVKLEPDEEDEQMFQARLRVIARTLLLALDLSRTPLDRELENLR